MSIWTQGTQLFALVSSEINPGEKEVVEIECFEGFDPGQDTPNRIQDTCMSAKAHSFFDGLITPGEGAININYDGNKYSSHPLLYRLSKGLTADKKDAIKWAYGLSDGESRPQLNQSKTDWVLPDDRTWGEFTASVSAFPMAFAIDDAVKVAVGLNRAGEWFLHEKAGGATQPFPTEYELEVTDAVGFMLRIGSQMTPTIAEDADANAIEQALDALAMADSVSVDGDSPSFTVELEGPQGELMGFGATVTAL